MLHPGLSVDQAACTAASEPLASCTDPQRAEWRALFSVLFSVKGDVVEDRYNITKGDISEKLDFFYKQKTLVVLFLCKTDNGSKTHI